MISLFLRDVRLGLKAGGGPLTGLLFFLAMAAVVPFGVGPNLDFLQRIGPAMLWLGALLAGLLGLDRLFQADRDDGSLDILVIGGGHVLALMVLVKSLAHWVANILPLVVISPVIGLSLNMRPAEIAATALTLLLGTPAIAFVGAAGSAVAVALPRGGLLVSVLVLPLVIPVLIFGVSAIHGAMGAPGGFLPPLLLLIASTMFLAVVGPFAAAIALRHASD